MADAQQNTQQNPRPAPKTMADAFNIVNEFHGVADPKTKAEFMKAQLPLIAAQMRDLREAERVGLPLYERTTSRLAENPIYDKFRMAKDGAVTVGGIAACVGVVKWVAGKLGLF